MATATVTVVAPPTSGTAYESLGWVSNFDFQGTTLDPLAFTNAPKKHAVIKSVKNISAYTYTLAHPDGVNVPRYYLLRPGDSVAIPGLVEGVWSAQYSGTAATIPAELSFSIDWKAPN